MPGPFPLLFAQHLESMVSGNCPDSRMLSSIFRIDLRNVFHHNKTNNKVL